jgi:hypothetical protein
MKRNSLGMLGLGIASVLLLPACTHLTATHIADGRQGYLIKCKGWTNSWSSCAVKAGNVCGARGYSVTQSDEYERTLMVACN